MGNRPASASVGGRSTCGSQNCKVGNANDLAQGYELLKDSIYKLSELSVRQANFEIPNTTMTSAVISVWVLVR
jgi:hypothetical protein